MVAEEGFCCFAAFLRGVLGKVVCRTWFLCGEFVVDCVVIVDYGRSLFGGRKMGHPFEVYFQRWLGGQRLGHCVAAAVLQIGGFVVCDQLHYAAPHPARCVQAL
jgi:hypothetical protein